MTVKDLYDLMMKFKENDFAHLEAKVDKVNDKFSRLTWLGITTLLTIVAGLIFLLVKK